MTCDLNQAIRTKSDSQGIIQSLVLELTEKFPNIDAEILNSEEIVERFGDKFSFKKGFVYNSKVVFNRDLFTIDTPLHEFGHLYIKALKYSNPKRYLEIINSTIEFKEQLNKLSLDYPELSQEDLQEEFFVQNLGHETDKLLSLYGDSKSKSLFRKLLDRFKHWLTGLTSEIGFSGVALKNVKSFNDILHQVGYEIMSPAFKQFIDPELLNDIKFQKASEIEDELDLLKTLIISDNKDFTKKGKDTSSLASNIRELIKNNGALKKTSLIEGILKEEDFLFDGTRRLSQNEILSLQRIISTFFSDVTPTNIENGSVRVVPLNQIHKEKGFTHIDPDQFKTHSNILVKIRFGEVSLFDFSSKSMNGIHNATLNRKNIAGVFITDKEAEKIGLTYTSNKVHVAKLQLGVLALRLRESNKSVKLGSIFIVDPTSINNKGSIVPQGTYIDEVIHNLNALKKIPSLSKLFTGDLAKITSIELNPDEVRISVEEHYNELLSSLLKKGYTFSHMTEEDRKINKQNVENIIRLMSEKSKPDKMQELIEALSARKRLIQDPHDTQKGLTQFYTTEIQLLNRYIVELIGVRDAYRQDDKFTVSVFQSFIDSVAKTGNPILDKLFHYMTMAASRVREYMVDFRTKDAEILQELVEEYRSISPGSFIEEFTINDSRKFFLDLIEYADAYDPSTNKKIQVRTGRFVQNGSKEFNNLTPKQKLYLNHFNKEADKSLKKLYGSKLSSVGFIPLMRKSSQDTLTEIASDPLNTKRSWNLLKETWDKFWNEGIDNYEYHLENQSSNSVAYDSFIGQHDNPKDSLYGNDHRLDILGLRYENGKLIVSDIKKNTEMETDLAYVLNSFVASNVRKAEFDNIQPITDSLKSFLIRNKETFSNITDASLAMFEDFYSRFVNESMSDAIQVKGLNKVISKLQSNASLAVLALNFGTDVKNLATGWATTLKEGIYNTFVKEGFSLISLAKANAYVTDDLRKEVNKKSILNKLNLKYGLYNMDFQHITGRDDLETSKSLFKSRNFFILNRLGDSFNRRVYAAASFIQEGSLDAYSLDKLGNLVYDEKKDLRFYNEDGSQTNLQKMYLKTVKNDMIQEGGLDKKGNLLYGHTIKQRNAMKSNMDRIYGSYDNDHASRMKSYAWGKALSSLRTYFIDKHRRYIGARGDTKNQYSENEGKYVPVMDEKGNVIAYDWQGESQEAILASAIMSAKEVFTNKGNFVKAWKSLTPKGRKNMIYLATDTLMFTLVYGLFSGLFDDEEDESLDRFVALYSVKGALEASSGLPDFGVTQQGDLRIANTYHGLMETPFFVTSFWADIMESYNRFIFSDSSEKQEEKDIDNILKNFPLMGVGTGYRSYKELEKIYNISEQ